MGRESEGTDGERERKKGMKGRKVWEEKRGAGRKEQRERGG